MKHLFTALFILMASATTMYGQTVSLSDAQQKASAFLSQHTAGAKGGTTAEVKLAYTAQQGDETYYYVFNQSGGGFVIVGGDEAARTILGYVDHGTFDYATAPENVKWWLGQYQQQISSAIKGVKQGTISLSQPAKGKVNTIARADIAPLVETTWDQNAPFNTAIPKILGNQYTSDGAFATGCVATATAQIMYKYKYPNVGIGSKSYNISYTGGSNPTITFEANFGATTYQWSKMSTSYTYNTFSGNDTGTGTDAEKAVAELMYHCGVAAGMEYGQIGNNGSSASNTEMAKGLISYFGYDKGMTREQRTSYADDEWAEMIYAELVAGRPVMYSGKTSGGGGHAFVCSGYKYDGGYDLFHLNWGWSGNYNGYFPLQGTANGVTAFKPDGTGTGGAAAGDSYDQSQEVIIGIMPDAGGAPKVTCNSMSLTSNSISPGNSLGVSTVFRNNSFVTLDITFGAKLVNNSTSAETYLEYNSYDDVSWGQGFSFTNYASTSLSMAAGTYTVYPYYKDGEGTWHPMQYDFALPTLTVLAADEGLYVSGAQTISDGGYVTPGSGTFTVRIWNNSSAAINEGTITAYIWKNGGGKYNVGSINAIVDFAAQEEKDVTFDFSNYYYIGYSSGQALEAGANYTIRPYYGGEAVKNSSSSSFQCTEAQTIDYKLSSAGWGTLCLPFSAEKPAGLTLYEVTDVEGSLLTKSEATEIAMNKAYLVSGTAGTYSFTGPTTPTGQYQNGLLVGNTTNEAVYVPQGSYVMQNLPATGLAFYKVAADNTQRCSPYKAYLKVPDALSYLYSSLLFTDSTTGITSTTDAETQKQSIRKTVKDGHIVIVTPNGTFTTAGTMIK